MMRNRLEALSAEDWQQLIGIHPRLPRVQAGPPPVGATLWVFGNGVDYQPAVPTAVREAVAMLQAMRPTSLVQGPALVGPGQWVALARPEADTVAGLAAHRRAFSALARQCRALPLDTVVVGGEQAPADRLAAHVEGLRLGWYRYPKAGVPPAPSLTVLTDDQAVWEAVRRAELASQATWLTRIWTEEAPNRLTPARFADLAGRLARAVGLSVRVIDPAEMRALGMGGVLAVGSGSENPPYLVVLRHRPDEAPAFGVVGKGITFDSGGIQLKPAENLRKLKGDKAGAAAVLAGACAAAQAGSEMPFIAILALAENLPDAAAYRPGDVVTMLDGTTVDIVSTDAEGRMVLADSITLARRYGCPRIMTLATLTRACIVALGNVRAALYANDDGLAQDITEAGERSGELMWRMPLDPDYALALRSPVADLLNSGEGIGAGSIVAAKFIQHFAPDTAWAHIDMSSIFHLDAEMAWGDKGYTGAGARLVFNLLLGTRA